MNVAGGARGVVTPFGQESDRAIIQKRDLLDGILHQAVVVRHFQCMAIADVNFGLPWISLALGVFDAHAGTLQTVANLAHQTFFLGGLEDMVILVISADGGHVAIGLIAQFFKTFAKHEELELSGHHRFQPHGLQAIDLLLQDSARRVRHFCVGMMIIKITQHHCGSFEPGQQTQCRHIGPHDVVTVTGGPAG